MNRRVLFIWMLTFVTIASFHGTAVQAATDPVDPVDADQDDDADRESLVVENKDYTPSRRERSIAAASADGDDDDDDDDDDSSDTDDEDEDEDEDEEDEELNAMSKRKKSKQGKTAINKAIAKSKKRYKKAIAHVKKNQAKLILTLTLYAFRREISSVLLRTMQEQRLTLTGALKILLFLHFMLSFMNRFSKQTGEEEDDDGVSGSWANQGTGLKQFIFQANPMLSLFLSIFMPGFMGNPAYIPPLYQHFTFERIKENYLKDGLALQKALHTAQESFSWPRSDPIANAKTLPPSKMLEPKKKSDLDDIVIVLDWTKLDSSLTKMDMLRDQISFLLSEYRVVATQTKDRLLKTAASSSDISALPFEVVVLLESPGGSAVEYGLAAQQLLRLRKVKGITVTVCVDKVGASGGYMIACTASPGRLFAAPFSVVGSIGVFAQILNAQQLLEGWGVLPLVFRGGKDKAPVGLVGEVTEEGKTKIQNSIDDTHVAFKNHVATCRPILADTIDEIGTGEVWLGVDAVKNGLVDRLITSDEYIAERLSEGATALKLIKCVRPFFLFGAQPPEGYAQSKVGSMLRSGMNKVATSLGMSATAAMPQALSTPAASMSMSMSTPQALGKR